MRGEGKRGGRVNWRGGNTEYTYPNTVGTTTQPAQSYTSAHHACMRVCVHSVLLFLPLFKVDASRSAAKSRMVG